MGCAIEHDLVAQKRSMEFIMIRPTTPNDTAASIALADATGLFEPNQLQEVREMLADYFGGNSGSDRFWIADDARVSQPNAAIARVSLAAD
ncbi:hypothetical protein QUA74_04530 [Microcoleus sp. LAD1_D3]|uniref:hypothetical protein n=1 Tax=Microcoleus sp. LAD1_D3 TaxID=2819365 RepID=UPI002FD49E26